MILSPKEKANELVLQFYEVVKNKYPSTNGMPLAKQCALIAVDEILKTRPGFPYPDELGLEIKGIFNIINYPIVYWQEVKQEIENYE
jgi:hypothetical protein